MKHIILSCLIVFGSSNLGFGQSNNCRRYKFRTKFDSHIGRIKRLFGIDFVSQGNFMRPDIDNDPYYDRTLGPVAKKVFRIGRKEKIYRVINFKAHFDHSITAVLGHLTKNERHGYNKIMRILSYECDGHKNYLTIGWRWSWDKPYHIEFTLYGHINHTLDNSPLANHYTCRDDINPINGREWFEEPLGSVRIGQWSSELELVFTSRGYYARVGNKGYAIRRDIEGLNEDEATAMEYYGHIGGTYLAGASKSNVITVSGYMDPEAEWWQKTDFKRYDRSIFYDGEVHNIYAKEEISACLPKIGDDYAVTNGTDGSKKSRFHIQAGATLNLATSSTGRLIFRSGFHAKLGSKMHAFIGALPNSGEPIPKRCITRGEPWHNVRKSDIKDSTTINNQENYLEENTDFIETKQSITAVPNPSLGNFKVMGLGTQKLKKMQIFNMKGSLIRDYGSLTVNNEFEINLEKEAPGLYLIKIIFENMNQESLKLVIQ